MIQTDFYMKRYDGIDLYRTYSDINHYIIQDQTGIEYEEAIDVEDSGFTYTESDREIEPIPEPAPETDDYSTDDDSETL